jgi:hypothetical protein
MFEALVEQFRPQLDLLRSDSRVSFRAGFHQPLSVEPWEAELLFLMVLKLKPKICVEFGTGYGFSALHIGKALEILKEGNLLTFELGENEYLAARKNIEKARLQNRISVLNVNCNDRLNMLSQVDFAFIDRNGNQEATYRDINQLYDHGCKVFLFHDFWSLRTGSPFRIADGVVEFHLEHPNWNLQALSGKFPKQLTNFPANLKTHPIGSESLALFSEEALRTGN